MMTLFRRHASATASAFFMASANIACRVIASASAKQPVSGFSITIFLPALAASMASA